MDNLLNKKYLVAIFLLLLSLSARGQECYNYSSETGVVVGIDRLHLKAARDGSKISSAMDSFINAAKSGNKAKVITNFSPFDGSRRYLSSELKKAPNKFSGYSGIKKYDLDPRFYKWGEYNLVNVDYQHSRGSLSFTEAFFCTTECLVSNVFENHERDPFIDVISRLIFLKKKGRLLKVNCPADSDNGGKYAQFSIYPKKKFSKTSPLNVYFLRKSFAQEKKWHEGGVWLKSLANKACSKALDDSSVIQNEVADVLPGVIKKCTLNAGEGELFPVNFIDDDGGVQRRYLTSSSYFLRAKDIARLSVVASFSGTNGVKFYVVYAEYSSREKSLAVVPAREQGSVGVVLDWLSFGDPLGELLSTEEVSKAMYDAFIN